jgi:hypothetical protein
LDISKKLTVHPAIVETYPVVAAEAHSDISAIPSQQDGRATTAVCGMGYALLSTRVIGGPSGTGVPALRTEHRSHAGPASRADRKSFRNRTHPRWKEGEIAEVSQLEIIRRKNLLIAHLRRRIAELQEALADMRSVYLDDDLDESENEMEDLTEGMGSMCVDTP